MTFVTIAAASLSAQHPLPVVVVRFVRVLRTTCRLPASDGSPDDDPRLSTRPYPMSYAHRNQLKPMVIVTLPGRRRSVAVAVVTVEGGPAGNADRCRAAHPFALSRSLFTERLGSTSPPDQESGLGAWGGYSSSPCWLDFLRSSRQWTS